MRDLETFKIKFFGSKHRKEQIKQVINGLKNQMI